MTLDTYVHVNESIPKFLMPINKAAEMTDLFHVEIKKLFIGINFHSLLLRLIQGHGKEIKTTSNHQSSKSPSGDTYTKINCSLISKLFIDFKTNVSNIKLDHTFC